MTVLDINVTPQTVRDFQRKAVVGNFVVKSDYQFRRPQDYGRTGGFCASLLLEVPVNKIKLRADLRSPTLFRCVLPPGLNDFVFEIIFQLMKASQILIFLFASLNW